jgi:hypothetical protein
MKKPSQQPINLPAKLFTALSLVSQAQPPRVRPDSPAPCEMSTLGADLADIQRLLAAHDSRHSVRHGTPYEMPCL